VLKPFEGGEVIDLHSHILPGLDDGAGDLGQSLQMARMAVEDGISGMVCTPHLSPSFPGNNREVILAAFKEFKARLVEEKIGLEVYPGCELAIDSDLPDKLASGELLTLNDCGHIALIEMPVELIPPHMNTFFWTMQVKGLTPILAHPERNYLLVREPSILRKWIEAGVLVQITGGSLKGHYGKRIRDFSSMLLKQRMVHFVSTDSHGPDMRRPVLSEARRIVESVVGIEESQKIFNENPVEVVNGRVPDVTPVVAEEVRKSSLVRRIFSIWK
jgi:protein-tyrosine phosphatase